MKGDWGTEKDKTRPKMDVVDRLACRVSEAGDAASQTGGDPTDPALSDYDIDEVVGH